MKQHTMTVVLFLAAVILAGPIPNILAANYDLKTVTPEVKQALEGRQDRYEEIQRHKAQGWIGENNKGYAADLKKTEAMTALVQEENKDRRVIYRAIIEQNGLGAEGLGQVEMVFGEVQRERSRAGDPIQLPSGEWSRK